MIRAFFLVTLVFLSTSGFSQDTLVNNEKYLSSDVIPLTGKQGFTWQTVTGDFLFKPYVLVQTIARANYFDDEGLDLSDQDNIQNSGFGIPYAMFGFSGKAFRKVTFNLAINAATTGASLLNQAWFDINFKESLRLRIGKFKTPFNQAYLVQLGETLFPVLPASLITSVNLPFDINSVNPNIATGFDVGVQLHGRLFKNWEYKLGIFNGTGITVNDPQRTTSDDYGIPSLLYACRLAWMPKGEMSLHQGNPEDLNSNKIMVAASTSYNVEANYESSNDFRTGIEFSWLYHRLYLNTEGYLMNIQFVERQKVSPDYTYWGGYIQAGYFITRFVQPAVRIDLFDRNSLSEKGILYLPAIGFNYYLFGYNLKMQGMYQMLCKTGFSNLSDENDDDNSMADKAFTLMLQFSF